MGQPKRKVLGFGIDAHREGATWEWQTSSFRWRATAGPENDWTVVVVYQGQARARFRFRTLADAGMFSEGFEVGFQMARESPLSARVDSGPAAIPDGSQAGPTTDGTS